jgi:hypothetical protein
MKKSFFIITAIFLSVFSTTFAVDFSGNWKLNTSKSTLSDQFSMAPKEIIILQDGNNLNLERHATFQDQDFTIKDKFTLDGAECINHGWQDSEKKSTAVWSDDKASLKITTKIQMGDNGEMTIIEVYKMDGANLVIESSSSSSFGDRSETMFFDKQ